MVTYQALAVCPLWYQASFLASTGAFCLLSFVGGIVIGRTVLKVR